MIDKSVINLDEFAAKPFLGIPFTTKDSTSVRSKLHTLGLVARKNTISKEDAECVSLAKKAGAIIIATTNIPEVNKWQETRNNLIGQTNNPYDVRRTVGGSSGGTCNNIQNRFDHKFKSKLKIIIILNIFLKAKVHSSHHVPLRSA